MTDGRIKELRIDRWLWFTRFCKTRSLATEAVAGGHVKINGARAKPGMRVAPGDRVQVVRKQLRYELEILSLPARRGPAAEAQATYVEDPDSRQRRLTMLDDLRRDRQQMPRTGGRPDKHTQRKLRAYNRRQDEQD